ncbi:MAG: biotin transporter BioY [Spirochaetales bacterium]
MKPTPLVTLVLTALMTGLMVASAFFTVPFPQVPLVLANAFAWLAGLLLGPVWGAFSVALYLLLGAFGLPVFAGGHSGVPTLLGTTGGFLLGYLLAAVVVGLLRDPKGKSLARTSLATLAGLMVIYLAGIPWLAYVAFHGPAGFEGANLVQAIWWSIGQTIPGLFVVGDLVKAAGVVAITLTLARLPGLSRLWSASKT